MDTRPEIPDPQHDRHVAFPEDRQEPLPESWWAPAPPPAAPSSPAEPPAAPPVRGRRQRRHVGWSVLLALFLFSSLMSRGVGTETNSFAGLGRGDASGQSSPGLDLTELPAAPKGTLESADASLYPIAPGTLWFRLEVAGNDPRGTLEVTGSHGSWMNAGEVALPYAARLTRNNPDETLTIMVNGAYGQRQVQCRVYLDDALVAIDTGVGTATCEVPGWR